MTSEPGNALWRATCAERIDAGQLTHSLTADLAIIGGGFTGCSAALEAATQGASVCLLEANEIGYGGSGRNVGLVNAGLWLKPDQIIKAAGQEEGERLIAILSTAPNKVFELIETHDIKCEATRKGTLHCAHSRAGLKDLKNRFMQGNRIGAPYQLLDAEETRKRTGSQKFHGALFDPRAGTIQTLSFCKGLARAAQEKGARIFQYSPATAISHLSGAWRVCVNGHTVTAKSLLLATNAYHFGMAAPFKPQFVKLGFMQFATPPLSDLERADILPGGEGCWDTALVMSSFRLDQSGRLIIGGVGDLTNSGGKIHEDWARRKLRDLFPQVKCDRFEYNLQGQIAMTSDHIPKIVAFGRNAFACFGYSGRGIGPGVVFGAATAKALLSGDASVLPLAPRTKHDEILTKLQEAYYNFGAILVHASGLNP